MFSLGTDEPVTLVNAPQLADAAGVELREMKSAVTQEFVNLITVRGGEHSVAGTLVGLDAEPRIVSVDDHAVEIPPAEHVLVIRNEDKPGMIGLVGRAIGDAGVNISFMALGRTAEGEAALMVLATDDPVSSEVCDRLATADGIVSVHPISL